VLLWAAMLGWDKWRRASNPNRASVHKGWLLALAFIGTLSHPALDWLNTYGVRLLEPFSSQWFYGDSIFIIDIWLWLGMGAALWASLRAERRAAALWSRPAALALVAASAYIFANGVLTGLAEKRVTTALRDAGVRPVAVVASPPPFAFWRRDVFWRDSTRFGETRFTPFARTNLGPAGETHHDSDPRIAEIAASNAEVAAFLLWSRMPVARFSQDGTLTLSDQRYRNPVVVDRFTVVAKSKPEKK
jgi:inner membrane protein